MSLTVEQLLVTLGIDSAVVQVSSSGRYVLVQRDPQPDETNIDIDSDVVMVLVDLDGDPTDAALDEPDFDLRIEGALALDYNGGVPTWHGDWDGTVEKYVVSSPYAFWKITAEQQVPQFESEQVVPVQLGIFSGGGWGHGPWGHFPWGHPPEGGGATTFLYEFTIQDLTPPWIVSAEAITPFTLRVTFNEGMALIDGGSPLNLDNWTGAITRLNVDPSPGVNLTVVAVAISDSVSPAPVPISWTYDDETARLAATDFGANDERKLAYQLSDFTYWMLVDTETPTWELVVIGQQFDLTMQWEMTPGCRYRIDAGEDITDDSGNLIDPVYGYVFFDGFVPEAVEGRSFSHWLHMVPLKNRIEDETRDLKRFSNCIEEVLGWMLHSVDHFTDQFDPDKATPAQIDAMLYDMGNPFSAWSELDLSDIEKKKLLRILIDIYKSKGTAWGIEQTVFFLLGEVVHCIPYLAGGWVLGVDELGSGSIAEIMNDTAAPWNFNVLVAPWELRIRIDGEPEQAITFVPGDFDNPTIATADEVVAVIVAQLAGGSAYKLFPGQPAVVTGTDVEMFSISPGDTIEFYVDEKPELHSYTFDTVDIGSPGFATADEVVATLREAFNGIVIVEEVAGAVELRSITRSEQAALKVQAGTVQAALGLSTGLVYGTDLAQISVYSSKAGISASVEITGGTANDALGFITQFIGSTGSAVLAPDDQYTLYSFDIETENVLTLLQTAVVRRVADYMKPAHEHLISIRTAQIVPAEDGWVLGVDALDETAELAE